MEHKRVNRVFAGIILLNIAVVFILYFLPEGTLDLDSIWIQEVIIETTLLLPAILGLTIKRGEVSIGERIGLKRIKPVTILLIVVYSILMIPIGSFANGVSMIFSENVVDANIDWIIGNNVWVISLFYGVVGPFCEELVFRGIIYRGYRMDGGRRGALILSSLMFGLMHMNANQAVYAFVLGLVLALIYEATGSLWASFLCHFIFNLKTTIGIFWLNYTDEDYFANMAYSRDSVLNGLLLDFIIAMVAAVFLIAVLKKIADLEDRKAEVGEALERFDTDEKKPRLISVAWVISSVLAVAWIVLDMIDQWS
ncbi:MAG: CPBP family intramembrane metalloprotease [Lachnospiraceae bacterium]|nr:CPBP family intramembrane metalloprotease [Lachnospiraceae bacterium]